MPSARGFALVSAVLLALFLWLRPPIGRLGEHRPPEVRGRVELDFPDRAAPADSLVAPVERAALPATADPARADGTPPSPALPIVHLDEVESLVFEATNERRKDGGFRPLKAEEVLRTTSRSHNADMLTRGFFDHVNSDGQTPEDRIALAHRRLVGLTGENIWAGSGYDLTDAKKLAQQIVEGWMGSPPHRDNIERSTFTHLGVGVSAMGDEIRATQNFAVVRAYLTEEVPRQVSRGTVLDLRMSVVTSPSVAERFDLWSSARGLRIAGPTAVADGTIDAEPGTYKLRFYFPEGGGRFKIVYGPQIEVAP